jgi:outer membrane protein, multidrug efflux system
MRVAAAAFSIALTVALGACEVGPHYRVPEPALPKAFAGAEGAQDTGNDAVLSSWWQQFGDRNMESLVTDALKSNLDLQSAASRIRQAREQEIIAGAAEWPSVNATGLGANVHSNSNPLGALGGNQGGAGGGGSSADNTATDLKLYSVGFDATWELDVFGGVRRGIEAARASADAAVWGMRDAEVSLSAEVALDYMNLCATRMRIALVNDLVQRERQTLEIVQARRGAGFVSELDVNQQRAQLAATSAQLPALDAEARAMTHALAVLLARNPEDIPPELSGANQLPSVPTQLPAGLPSDLLRRRPDVRQAERRLAAATAEIGVAVAQLYPHFDIIAAASFANGSLSNLVSSQHFSRIGAGLIRWPVFQAGKVRANVKVAEEQRNQAYLAYQKAVLGALRDTEDALTRFAAEQQRLKSLEESEQAASSSLDIAQAQYRSGLVPFINVLSANAALLDARGQLVESRMALAQDGVSLYKALGGGWPAQQ